MLLRSRRVAADAPLSPPLPMPPGGRGAAAGGAAAAAAAALAWLARPSGAAAAGATAAGGGGGSASVGPGALGGLHDDIINHVLSTLEPNELIAAALVCTRLKGLAFADALWGPHFAARWGAPLLASPAAALAGSWRRLYSSKAATEAEAAPWRRPCEWELQAALKEMVASAHHAAPRPRAGAAPACAHGEGGGAEAPGAHEPDLAVVFLVDGSGSVGEDDFDAMTAFINAAARAFACDAPSATAAVLQFSNTVRVEAPLAPLAGGAGPLTEAVVKMVRMNGGTNVAAALAQAGAALKAGAPPGAGRLVLLLTDGRIDGYQSREAQEMAARLADEQSGISIWALGVGRGVDRQELHKILDGAGPGAPEARYIDLCVRDDAPW